MFIEVHVLIVEKNTDKRIFTNGGPMIDVCLLGCGGMMPLPNRGLSALLCRQNGKMILLDCGEGTQVSIKLAGWGFKSIEALCVTHYHADHIVGLPGFLLTLGNSGRVEPLTIFGPPYLSEIVNSLRIIAPALPFEIILVELSEQWSTRNHIGDFIVKSLPVDHNIPCLAYSIEVNRAGKFDVQKAISHNIPMKLWNPLQKGEVVEYEGKTFEPNMVLGNQRKGLKITYSTDTRPTEALIDFARESDLYICEGMYGDDALLPKAIERKHMTFSEAAALANKSDSKELWLTHYSPSLEYPNQYINNAKNIFTNTILGEDIMKKVIKFEN